MISRTVAGLVFATVAPAAQVADLKKHVAVVYARTVQGRAMPLGNQPI